MNNCEFYQELISRLVDGEVSRNEYAALESHMKNCAECSAMYAVFASLSDIIGGEDEPLPEDLHENIMAGVRRSAMINHNRRRLSKPVRNALAAAACAAVVLFASRGLAPEKAADTVLSENQTAAMDVQREKAAPAAESAAVEPAAQPSLAVSPAPVPTASPEPVAAAKPTQDIYLFTEEEEAKPASGNTKNNTNTVAPTPKPVEIVVDTPVTVATPKPTATPGQIVTITAAPMPPAPVQPTDVPAVVAEAAAQPEMAAIEPAAEKALENLQPAEAAEPAPASESLAAAPAAEPVETEAVETEEPTLSKRLFSFFGLARPEAVSEPEAVVQSEAESESPAEAVEPEPEAVAEEAAAPAEEEAEEKEEENLIKLASIEKLTELEELLDGEEAELPEGEADEEYIFVLAEPEEGLEEYEIKVCIYGESVYYVQSFSEEDFINCLAPCKLEDFEKFMESLSDEEKGIEPSASPEPSAQPEGEEAAEESPAVTEPSQAEQSPVPTEALEEQ